MNSPPPARLNLHVPFSTIARVLFTVLATWCLLRLWPEVVFVLLSILLAVALEPSIAWAERRGAPRGVAVLVFAIGVLGVIVGFAALAMPPLVRQLVGLIEQYPVFRERLLAQIPEDSPIGRTVVEQLFSPPSGSGLAPYMGQTLLVGATTLSGVATTFFVIITTLYFLLDGKRLYAWLLAYVPRVHRPRVAATIPEVFGVVTAYVRGQIVTSLLFGVFVAILLQACHVPAVIPLAVIAGVCDVIPVVGVVIAIVPAALLALTVSPIKAVIVVVGYVVYHQIEAYVLVPRIYGSTLRLSTLAVLLALLVGGTLQGLLGAVLILPIVAAYPIIERIWLKDYLAADVIRDHKALERAAESGTDHAVEAVLQGVEHPGELASVPPPPVQRDPRAP